MYNGCSGCDRACNESLTSSKEEKAPEDTRPSQISAMGVATPDSESSRRHDSLLKLLVRIRRRKKTGKLAVVCPRSGSSAAFVNL